MSKRWHRPAIASAGAAAAALLGLALIAVTLLGLTGRSDASTLDIPRSTQPAPVLRPLVEPSLATTAPPRPVPLPVAVRVPEVDISSRLVPLGLNPDNTLQVPKDFSVAGWYTGRPVPGQIGPSVLAGHVDSKRGPAVFYRLRDVRPGMTIEVERSDATVARFVVVAVEEHDKDAFPTERVYGPTATPQIRLITCGGRFDRKIGHYTDNIIVFADLTSLA